MGQATRAVILDKVRETEHNDPHQLLKEVEDLAGRIADGGIYGDLGNRIRWRCRKIGGLIDAKGD